MREILFRGKNTDAGEWVYGSFIPNMMEVYMGDTEIDGFIKPFGRTPQERKMVEILRDTVGQYTGLKDIHGVKIFEGDIVCYDGSCHKVVFENRNGAGYFGIVVGENETWGFGNSTPAYMMAVVGNIHDNPELLEVSKE